MWEYSLKASKYNKHKTICPQYLNGILAKKKIYIYITFTLTWCGNLRGIAEFDF